MLQPQAIRPYCCDVSALFENQWAGRRRPLTAKKAKSTKPQKPSGFAVFCPSCLFCYSELFTTNALILKKYPTLDRHDEIAGRGHLAYCVSPLSQPSQRSIRMKHRITLTFLSLLLLTFSAQATETNKAVVIYEDKATNVGAAKLPNVKADDLWITLADLKAATGFVNKPQGVCREELCFPLPKKRRAEFLQPQGKTTWFNLTEFARLLNQPVARDAERGMWYFGPRAETQNGLTQNFQAPDFTLPDKDGKLHSLSDFRGKKVLIVTWASW
jgi:hypothetical protein